MTIKWLKHFGKHVACRNKIKKNNTCNQHLRYQQSNKNKNITKILQLIT